MIAYESHHWTWLVCWVSLVEKTRTGVNVDVNKTFCRIIVGFSMFSSSFDCGTIINGWKPTESDLNFSRLCVHQVHPISLNVTSFSNNACLYLALLELIILAVIIVIKFQQKLLPLNNFNWEIISEVPVRVECIVDSRNSVCMGTHSHDDIRITLPGCKPILIYEI
eukprot:TRINITY_DN10656_c0_g1_i1.p1 TRINITY_DN10656_c0_g1~~TRINITY_DN10656_c0_g1_i1.p1  ORF type:complete len:166 (+),score=13.77 TRINITY_DN10656_c0_g1_i1:275-772(+)